LNEQELVEEIKKGREAPFIELVDKYKRKILSLCYSYTQDYQEAEDISQEVFISIYKNIGAFKGNSSLSTYIYKITANKCLDYKRKKSIKTFLSGLFEANTEYKPDLEEKNYIKDSIKKLPTELSLPIILYYYIGLSQSEIGSIMNISKKNVEGRIYRGKQKLKIAFQKEGFELCRGNGTILTK